MTTSIEWPASLPHVSPYPGIGAPCCGRPVTDYEPVPPGSMLLGLGALDGVAGMVSIEETSLSPDLRGTRRWNDKLSPGPRFGSIGCCGARRTAMSGLRGLDGFPEATIAAATDLARDWALEAGLPVPPMPTDIVEALYRLAQTEREVELLRGKLRSMRGAGIVLSADDLAAYKNAADTLYKASLGIRGPLVEAIRTVSPLAAAMVPQVSRPLGIDDPERALPYVPTEEELARVRSGDFSGVTGRFGSMVSHVRSRLSGSSAGGMRGLGLFGIDDLTIGVLLLIVVGLVAVSLIAISIAIPAYALAQVLSAWVVSRAAAGVADRRREFYERCLATGSSSSACATDAARVVEMPKYPPAPSAFDLSGLVMGGVVLGVGYFFLGTPKGRSMVGLSGLKMRRRRGRR